MATGGGWKIQKGYEGTKYSVRRFAYDVLGLTLSKCGYPETHLRVKIGEENEYRHSDYVVTVHSAVMFIAFSRRDDWRRMFEYKQKRFDLNNMIKIVDYLVNIEVMPEFGKTYDLDKIRRSLSFYSELILFLHYNKVEVNFAKLLDIWTCYFNEKIGVKMDSDIVLEGIFIEDPYIAGYLSLVDHFIKDVANPYGKMDDVSKRFRDFCKEVEKFYDDLLISTGQIAESSILGSSESLPRNLTELTSEEESISTLSTVIRRNSYSADSLGSPESAGHPDDDPLPSTSSRGTEETIEGKKIGTGDTVLPGPSKSPELQREIDTLKELKIWKGYEGQKFSVRRFALEVLYITLSKCGFPKTHMRVKVGKKNDYRHPNYVITVHSAVMCIAFSMRDEWKLVFEYQLKRSMLTDMQKIEDYLANIEVMPEFGRTYDLDKIRRSLAFYSEVILFLHYKNIKVNFAKILDVWTRYFDEKIAVNEDPDVLLEGIYIEDPNIKIYLKLVDRFIEEFADPYGKSDDVSTKFKDFSEGIEKLSSSKHEMSVAEMLIVVLRRLESASNNLFEPIPEEIQEVVSFFSEVFGTGLSLRDIDSPKPQFKTYFSELPHLPSLREMEEEIIKHMNLTPPESEDES